MHSSARAAATAVAATAVTALVVEGWVSGSNLTIRQMKTSLSISRRWLAPRSLSTPLNKVKDHVLTCQTRSIQAHFPTLLGSRVASEASARSRAASNSELSVRVQFGVPPWQFSSETVPRAAYMPERPRPWRGRTPDKRSVSECREHSCSADSGDLHRFACQHEEICACVDATFLLQGGKSSGERHRLLEPSPTTHTLQPTRTTALGRMQHQIFKATCVRNSFG